MRKAIAKTFGQNTFAVHVVPVLKDNYSYVIHDFKSGIAAAVDVSEAKPVLAVIDKLGAADKFMVLTTHKHWDHSGGNKDLAAAFGKGSKTPMFLLPGDEGLRIVGGAKDNIPNVTNPVNDNDTFDIGALTVRVLFAPCHTSGHVLYHVFHPDHPSEGALFSGDTLFVGGIGAFFEGTAKDMLAALDRVAKEVPPETSVFPGHEYTVNFLKFSSSLDKSNGFIKEQLNRYEQMRAEGLPTIPSTIQEELVQNLFMRCRDADLRKATGQPLDATPEAMMDYLYNMCP